MTADDLAQAIVNIRTRRFPSLTEERNSKHVGSQPIATNVRELDREYANALLWEADRIRKRREEASG